MNKFTLNFLGRDVEKSYRQKLRDDTYHILVRNIACLLFMDFLWFILGLVKLGGFNLQLLVPLSKMIFCVIITIVVTVWPNTQDLAYVMIQAALNSIFVLQQTGIIRSVNFDDYRAGYSMAYACQCFNMGSRTYLKQFSVFINIIVVSLVGEDVTSTKPKCTMITLTGIMSIFFIYFSDRVQKQSYLIQYQQQLWETNLDEVGEVGMLQVKVHKSQNQLQLIKSNKLASQQFCVVDDTTFREFSRNFLVMLPSNQPHMNEIKMRLEQFLHYMFADDDQKQTVISNSKSISQKESTQAYNIRGIYHSSNFRVQIFSFWREEQITVISISKLEETLEVKTMRFKQDILRNVIKQYNSKVTKALLPAIALLSRFQPFFECEVKQKQLHRLYTLSEYKLYDLFRQNLNNMIFFQPKFDFKCHKFLPRKVLNSVFRILQNKMKKLGIRVASEYTPSPSIRIITSYQLLHQIIFNIIEQILSVSKKGGQLYVVYQQLLKKQGQHDYIEFIIATNSNDCTELLQGQTWVLNPLSLKNCMKISSNKNLHINLSISHYLVGLIGPYSKIEYVQDETICSVKFRIYSNLQDVRNSISSKNTKVQIQPKIEEMDDSSGLFNRTLEEFQRLQNNQQL